MPRSRTEDGFTLVELLVVMIVGSILLGLGVTYLAGWRGQADERATADRLVSALRSTAERSVEEGRTYCVAINASSYQLWLTSCSAGTLRQTATLTSGRASVFAAATGATPCVPGRTCIYFRPRGTATAATVTVSSSARSATYTVHVEGLTSRVWL